MTAMTGEQRPWQDLMEMSVADWLDVTPSELMELVYGDAISMTPSEWLQATYGQASAGGRGGMRRRRGRLHDAGRRYGGDRRRTCQDCGRGEHDCPRCAPDSCQCSCCVGDVDLVVEARLGERRVVPIVVENERRREKNIRIELSEWTTRRGKDSPVTTTLLTPKEFALEPCASVEVTIVVDIASDPDDGNSDDTPSTGTAAPDEDRQRPDVDDCLVAIADLRVVGCDHRPVRIAVAILPRDCDPYTVTCGCSCC